VIVGSVETVMHYAVELLFIHMSSTTAENYHVALMLEIRQISIHVLYQIFQSSKYIQ